MLRDKDLLTFSKNVKIINNLHDIQSAAVDFKQAKSIMIMGSNLIAMETAGFIHSRISSDIEVVICDACQQPQLYQQFGEKIGNEVINKMKE